jgi:hypothetical protein
VKSVIVAWCNQNEKVFENQAPLLFVGRRNQSLGFKGKIHIIFLTGFNRLSPEYIASLKDVGYELHNVEKLFFDLDIKFAPLNRFGEFEKRCFLRWLVLMNYFGNEPIIHYDGDFVFNEDVAVIEKILAGKTFFLQGSAAFASISDPLWFEQYSEHLNAFVKDIEGYSAQAWSRRNGWELSYRYRWAGSRFRKIITSDQDLLVHLVHTRNIKQDDPEEISLLLQDYMIFQNPLFIHLYDENFPYEYSRESGIDYFSYIRQEGANCFHKKRVLFWHMQSTFNFYLSKYMLRQKFFRFLPMGRLTLDVCGQGFEDKLNKRLNRFIKHVSRLKVYHYFFGTHDFRGVLNASTWWKLGIFAKIQTQKFKLFDDY